MKSENKWNQTVHRQKIPTQGKKTELICSSFWSWGNRLQKWLESLDNNAHIWPELSFILHAQCCHSCQLHSQTKSMITFVSYYLLMKIWFELRCMRVCVCVCVCVSEERERYLSNSFRRIFSLQFWIHTLFNFVFTQPWSSL